MIGRVRTTARFVVLLSSLPLVSSCVGLTRLDSLARKNLTASNVAVPEDPCPDPRPKAVARFLHAPRSVALAPSNLASLSISGTDLDVGKRLLSSAPAPGTPSLTPAAATTRNEIGATLGFSLSGLGENGEDLTEEGVTDAEAALAAPPGFAVGAPATGRRSFLESSPSAAQVAVSTEASLQSIRAIARATTENGWESSFVAALGRYHKAGGLASLRAGSMTVEQTQLYAELVKRFLVAQYFKAYFRNGKIISVKMSTEKLKAALKAKLESTITDPALREKVRDDIDSLSDDIIAELCGDNPNCLALGTIGETTFTTRAGKSYGFAGINVDLDPAGEKKISIEGLELSPELVSDLVRVLVEALGDFKFAVPGVPKSTACDYGYLCSAPADAEMIAEVNEIGDKVEAGTSSAVGIAIRGGWIVALNNEVLASGIQTALAVSFRKIAEKAAHAAKSPQCPGIIPTGMVFRSLPLSVN